MQEWPAQAKIDAMAVEDEQSLFRRAIRALDRIVGTHRRLRSSGHRLKIARQEEQVFDRPDARHGTYAGGGLLVGRGIKAHGHAGVAALEQFAMAGFQHGSMAKLLQEDELGIQGLFTQKVIVALTPALEGVPYV